MIPAEWSWLVRLQKISHKQNTGQIHAPAATRGSVAHTILIRDKVWLYMRQIWWILSMMELAMMFHDGSNFQGTFYPLNLLIIISTLEHILRIFTLELKILI